MIPLSRKPSFPPPPPPPYHHKRSYRLSPEDLHILRIQPPPRQPLHTRHDPALTERPTTPFPRTPSPSLSSVVDLDIVDQFPLPRQRSVSQPEGYNHVPRSRGRPPPSPPPSLSIPTSVSSAPTSAYLSASRSTHRASAASAATSSYYRPTSHSDYAQSPVESFLPSPTSPTRSRFRSVLGLSKAGRQANAQISEATARQTAEERRQQLVEERERRAVQEREKEATTHQILAQDKAKDHVRARVTALLQGRLPPGEDRKSTLAACAQFCERQDLDLSTVLQEMSIEGYPPIYWAIVNRAVASESRGMAPDSLMADLLAACRPLSPDTLAAIRVACTMASDNILLQDLFRCIPPLSHISTRDALLLGPAKEEDRVDVEEKRNGTGSWAALIKIPRFRLRMRVCQSVSVEFIASGRMWILTFSAVTEITPDGRAENRWYLSLELEAHSPPSAINATLVILGSPETAEDGDSVDLFRSIQICPAMSELSPGHDKAFKIRLDDGPMGPYLLNESSLLVDSNKALYARLTQSAIPVLVADTSSGSSRSLEPLTPTSPSSDITYNAVHYHTPRPPEPPPPAINQPSSGPSPRKQKKKKKQQKEKVYTSLRRGGR